MKSYHLSSTSSKPNSTGQAFTSFLRIIRSNSSAFRREWISITIVIVSILINIGASVATPYIIARVIDGPIAQRNVEVLFSVIIALIILFIVSNGASYFQARIMGRLSQNVLFRLRNQLFTKIQSLPVSFFAHNQIGDLISRINNDTDKINQFLSESVLRFISIFFSMVGIAVIVLYLKWELGLLILGITGLLILITRLVTPFLEAQNKKSLEAQGGFGAEVQESLLNFKVLVAFQLQDYFQYSMQKMSNRLFETKLRASTLNESLAPFYTFASNIAQVLILLYGVYLIQQGQLTVGLLIGFISYAQKFFEPLRILGSILGTLQSALAAWVRVSEILSLETDLTIIPDVNPSTVSKSPILSFDKVSFGYSQDKKVLSEINLDLEVGKTYALVGATGGGKTTTASLMARLFDPDMGSIRLYGKDIRSYTPAELSNIIGFILQEPFLFSGTIADNLRYGNDLLQNTSDDELKIVLTDKGFLPLIESFERGIQTLVIGNSENISLGQKQIISFIRAVLREPKILILDEATANIDTITEQRLQNILDSLSKETTKVIIAHRLNTIKNADHIFFVGGGDMIPAENVEQAIELIENTKKRS